MVVADSTAIAVVIAAATVAAEVATAAEVETVVVAEAEVAAVAVADSAATVVVAEAPVAAAVAVNVVDAVAVAVPVVVATAEVVAMVAIANATGIPCWAATPTTAIVAAGVRPAVGPRLVIAPTHRIADSWAVVVPVASFNKRGQTAWPALSSGTPAPCPADEHL